MGGWIIRAKVSLDFDNAADYELTALLPNENFAQQIRTDQARVAIVKGAGEGAHGSKASTVVRRFLSSLA